jgi:5-formyltetrahydrofolate cyclo-ligase
VCTARASRPAVDRAADGDRLAAYAAALLAVADPVADPLADPLDDPARTRPTRITVAAYAGIDEEPPTRPLLDALVALGARVLLPVVVHDVAGLLDWAPYDGWDALAIARWGLREPTTERLGPGALDQADVVAVPSLAVDRAGHRLGRGRGYYDRALTPSPLGRRVAVVYASELLDRVPSEPHDQNVGWALTPNGLIRLATAPTND